MVPRNYEMGERFRQLRIAFSGDNQSAFARSLGIKPNSWNNYENGYLPSRGVIELLCKRFPGLSSDWLLFGNPGLLSASITDKLGLWRQPGAAHNK